MAKAQNRVIAGDYKGRAVERNFGDVFLNAPTSVFGTPEEDVDINKKTVKSYELLTNEDSKNVASGIARGLIGGTLFGVAGMLVGGMSSKTNHIYRVSIEFCDGKRSLLEVDDKLYKAIEKVLF